MVNLSDLSEAGNHLLPTPELAKRFKMIGPNSPSDEADECFKAYLKLVRSRYLPNIEAFQAMVSKPLLVAVIGREYEATTWERIAIQSVLMNMAVNQGRTVKFFSRVLPTRLPHFVA